MSLLNDALRKKKSERYEARQVPVPGWSKSGAMSHAKRQWIVVSGGIGMLAAAAAVWLVLCTSAPPSGNPGAGSLRYPGVTRAVDAIGPQSAVSPLVPSRSVPPSPAVSTVLTAAATAHPAGYAPEARSAEQRPAPSSVRQSSTSDQSSSGKEEGGLRKHADTEPVAEKGLLQERRNPEPQESVPHTTRAEPPGESDRLFQRACRFHRRHELDQAIALYQAVLKESPDHIPARSNLVAAYLQARAYQQAYPIAARLFSEDPANRQNMLNLAIAQIGCGRDRQALALLDKAVKLPDAPLFEIAFHQAVALGHIGRTKSALACYRRAENMRPDDPDLLFNIALVCDQQQQYGDAVNYYLRYLQHSGEKDTPQIRQIRRRVRILQAYGAEVKMKEQTGE